MPSTTLLGMSIPVTGDDLTTRLEEYGSACFLVTVGADGSPKVVHVPVLWDGEVLRCTPGAGTLRNLGDGGSATLVFPAPVHDAHSMLLDGTGRANGDVAVVSVDGGVLHRPSPVTPGDEVNC